jgi:arsenate reductase
MDRTRPTRAGRAVHQPPTGDVLGRAIADLTAEFAGILGADTVARCVEDSYAALSRGATVSTYLPLLSHRFARERLRAAARPWAGATGGPPAVLFVCTHNSGRSQMAAGWATRLAPTWDVWSAGTEPAGEIAAAVADVMAEVGIDLGEGFPKPLTDEVVAAADVIITLGCGGACAVLPGRRYEDWVLEHPIGDSPEQARAARDEIRARVEQLVASFGVVP